VNAIAPGAIGDTEGMRRFADAVEGTEERGANNPVGLLGHGSDIAYTVLFLCSPVARFISGQVIAVDGAASVDQLKLRLAPD
jgi:NAD(P)-dependent dehydrogenase (short-subunit alcohol dehydrogenase family)